MSIVRWRPRWYRAGRHLNPTPPLAAFARSRCLEQRRYTRTVRAHLPPLRSAAFGSFAKCGWTNPRAGSSNITRDVRMSNQCLQARIASAASPDARNTRLPVDSARPMRPGFRGSPRSYAKIRRYRTSTTATGASGVPAIVSWFAILSATCAIVRRRRSLITSRHIAAYRYCSGLNGTGKVYVSRVTGSRRLVKRGADERLPRVRIVPAARPLPIDFWLVSTLPPQPSVACCFVGPTRCEPETAPCCRRVVQGAGGGVLPAAAHSSRFRAAAGWGGRKTFAKPVEKPRGLDFCMRQFAFGGSRE